MIKIKRLKTNKLFFNKWPYKVACTVSGASKVVRLGVDRAEKWCKGEWTPPFNSSRMNVTDKSDLLKFIRSIKSLLPFEDNIKIRAEGAHFNMFFKDPELLKKIEKKFAPWIESISEPSSEEECNFLMSNDSRKVLCDEIPKSKYVFKVYLKEAIKSDTREQFLQWSKKYGDDVISISPETTRWLSGEKSWKQDPFFYVNNASMMTMVRIFLGDSVRRVYEYVPRNKLETV